MDNIIKLRDRMIHLKTKKIKCTGSRIPANPSLYVYIMLKEMNIIAFNSNSIRKKYMLKNENSALKIYIRTIKQYTDIDPTIDFVFPVNEIDRENSDKNSYLEKIEITKCVFRIFRL